MLFLFCCFLHVQQHMCYSFSLSYFNGSTFATDGVPFSLLNKKEQLKNVQVVVVVPYYLSAAMSSHAMGVWEKEREQTTNQKKKEFVSCRWLQAHLGKTKRELKQVSKYIHTLKYIQMSWQCNFNLRLASSSSA